MNSAKNENDRRGTIADWLVLACLFFSAFASLATDKMNSYALYVVLPLAFVICFLQSKTIVTNKYIKLLLLLYLWEALSLLWASYPAVSMRVLRAILGAFLVSYMVSVLAKKNNVLVGLYLVYFALLISAWNYASNNLLIVTDFATNERLNDAKLNANTMAYYTTYVTFGAFILNQIVRSKSWKFVFDVFFFAMIPITAFTALTTASRQIFIIQIPFIALLLWLRFFKQSKSFQKTFFLIIVVVFLVYFLPRVVSVYEGSFLAQRSEISIEEDSRSALAKEAIMVGLNHFPLGVGTGNVMMYSKSQRMSHNSYTELFANVGVVGVVLFLIIVFGFAKAQWKRYKVTKDKMFAYFSTFGIIFIIDQFFYVFYLDQWLISFFILVATHSETYYNNLVHR